uniref:Uncharacterized protein n=1 Tax=Rhizophora mucronata TaxID=61149 RepID=A0A2P2QG95_RHIMU
MRNFAHEPYGPHPLRKGYRSLSGMLRELEKKERKKKNGIKKKAPANYNLKDMLLRKLKKKKYLTILP